MPISDWNIVLSLGLVLTAALVAGAAGRALHLPRVTAYLLVGLALGPHALGIIPAEHLEHLDPLGKLAMALVLMVMGCHFSAGRFARMARRAVRFSASEIGLTFLLVAVGLALIGQPWQASVLFGALAIATAPATTTLVLTDMDSEGPVTEYAITLVALNNLAAVVVFEGVLVAVQATSAGNTVPPVLAELQRLLVDLGGSILLGVASGLIVSYLCALLARERWLVLLFAVATLLLGFCETMEIPYLLTFLALGATIANASELSREIASELERLTGLLCVVFFVVHGAELDLVALRDAGLVGVGYIVLRLAGKYFGIYLSADGHQDGVALRRWLGATLWAQAGAAIALSAVAASPAAGLGPLGHRLQVVILGTVVFFEIVGPVATRWAVLRAGEVPLDHAILHTSTTPLDELRHLVNRILIAFGRNPWAGRSPGEVTVEQVMRRNFTAVPAVASFKEVVAAIEHAHANLFPVTDQDERLVGVIRYADLRDALFDPGVGRLVRAADLATPPVQTLHTDSPIADALLMFQQGDDDTVPVVAADGTGRLVGIVRRRDLFRYFLGNQQAAAGEPDPQAEAEPPGA